VLNPDQVYQKLIDAGEYWADADAAASMYEETKKSVLAQLMSDCGGSTHAERERMALATEIYQSHVEQMVQARKEANRALVKYKSIQVWADLKRTQESTRRKEIEFSHA